MRACAAVVADGTILMVRHVHDGRDYWTLPGGGVELGETPEQAALRELREEANLAADFPMRAARDNQRKIGGGWICRQEAVVPA